MDNLEIALKHQEPLIIEGQAKQKNEEDMPLPYQKSRQIYPDLEYAQIVDLDEFKSLLMSLMTGDAGMQPQDIDNKRNE